MQPQAREIFSSYSLWFADVTLWVRFGRMICTSLVSSGLFRSGAPFAFALENQQFAFNSESTQKLQWEHRINLYLKFSFLDPGKVKEQIGRHLIFLLSEPFILIGLTKQDAMVAIVGQFLHFLFIIFHIIHFIIC